MQALAELRLKDAEALLAAGQWDAAHYLLGYCIECALKACFAKSLRVHAVPDKKLVSDFYTHDFGKLRKISGVDEEMLRHGSSDANFANSWNIVKDWKETARYEIVVTEAVARGMYEAVTNEESGVLPWLKIRW